MSITDEDREWIDARADQLFRESERARSHAALAAAPDLHAHLRAALDREAAAIARAEAAEAEVLEQARLNGMGSEREAKLMGDLDVLTAEVERLRAICRDVPAALNSAFAAGTEECEGGSARRQEKALAPVDGMRRRIRAALASEPRA